jgi:hypothetical protein
LEVLVTLIIDYLALSSFSENMNAMLSVVLLSSSRHLGRKGVHCECMYLLVLIECTYSLLITTESLTIHVCRGLPVYILSTFHHQLSFFECLTNLYMVMI